jgi:hypothetical protein
VAAELSAERLGALVMKTLEDAAFVFAEVADGAPPFSPPVLEARLRFEGPEAGELALATSPAMAQGLAANLLGLDPGDPEIGQRAGDALGELANILAGAVVLELFGPRVETRIGVPSVREVAAAPAGEAPCAVTLSTEEGERLDASYRPAGKGPP